jgi:hypothetical protein
LGLGACQQSRAVAPGDGAASGGCSRPRRRKPSRYGGGEIAVTPSSSDALRAWGATPPSRSVFARQPHARHIC